MMLAQPRRPYRSESRARGAELTRERVIATAGRLFADHGYAGTSMRGIAKASGVSLERVTATGTKSELLLAAFHEEFADGGQLDPDTLVPLDTGDLRAAVAPAVEEVAVRIARSLGIWRALTVAATVDEAVARARLEMVDQRRAQIVGLLGALESVDLLPARSDRERRRVADAVGLIASHEAYEQLVTLCGWTEDDHRAWAVEACCAALSRPL